MFTYVAGLIFALTASAGSPQQVASCYFGDKVPEVFELITALTEGCDQAQGPSRGIILEGEDTAVVSRPQNTTQTAIAANSVRQSEGREGAGGPVGGVVLNVKFEFDSARLTPDAQVLLGNLAMALSSEALQGASFLVAGHTDSVGTETYNLRLSERRAEAVKDFMSGVFGLRRDRILTVGKGEAELFDPTDGESAVNRRVEVTNLGNGGAAQLVN